MPSIPLHPQADSTITTPNNLPQLLHTPLGLAILEVQGTLHLPTNSLPDPDASSDNASTQTEIGKLTFPLLDSSDGIGESNVEGPWMKKVFLYIGQSQRLAGEIRKLPRPIGVVRRREGTDDEQLEIMDVVRWKLYFGARPEFV